MTVHQIAEDIYRELDEPDNVTITQIYLWLKASIGRVNALLYREFEYISSSDKFMEKGDPDDDDDEDEEMAAQEAEILKHIYFDRFYRQEAQRIRNKTGTEYRRVTEGDRTVELSNTAMMIKELNALAASNKELLNDLVEGYFLGRYKPKSIDYLNEYYNRDT